MEIDLENVNTNQKKLSYIIRERKQSKEYDQI